MALVPAAVVGLLISELWSGPRLAWDMVALESVRVGQSFRGVIGLPDIKYLLVGYHEVSTDTYHRLTWAHVLVVPSSWSCALLS
jgi:quinol-cytochrome oxidoreductase complex cytochrome b subunit